MIQLRYIVALLSGALFGFGLVISGMTNTNKVLGFLDVQHWDSDLMYVMVGAIAICILPFFYAERAKKPFAGKKFYLPTSKVINKDLILGAILFGIGWGLYGLCPAPAIIALQYGDFSVTLFFIAMLVGFYLKRP